MIEVTCPDCGTTSQIDPARRDITGFCPNCDYPLFWARSAHGTAVLEQVGSDLATRRLPGTGGQVVVGNRECPNCGELNQLGVRFCIRCAVDMDPPPAVPEVYVAPPPPEPEPEPVAARRPWWPWAVAALVLALIIILIIVL